MDVDWCLSCERRLARPLLPPSGPYCSPACLAHAQPTSPTPLPDTGAHRIRQWARAIPPHVPAGAPTHPFADTAHPSERPPSPRPRPQPTPKLIERTAACTPLPTLCISSPAHVRPPPARALSHTYSRPTASTCMSEASTSLSSLLSEPMVATPDEDMSFGANIGAFVRGWVSRDRANSTKSTQDLVIEKVTDYFPPLPHPKRPSPSKKLKRTPPESPAPAARHKFVSRKAVAPADRDRSTPTHSHTPTPVIFPSCRAWVDEEDEVQDDLLVAPQPQYHPAYYACESPVEPIPWIRAPSSVSSSDSSILLMAPKRTDGLRGRIGRKAIVV